MAAVDDGNWYCTSRNFGENVDTPTKRIPVEYNQLNCIEWYCIFI